MLLYKWLDTLGQHGPQDASTLVPFKFRMPFTTKISSAIEEALFGFKISFCIAPPVREDGLIVQDWTSYVQFIRGYWLPFKEDDDNKLHAEDEKIPIGNYDGCFDATSGVDDYRYRPMVYREVNLYEWIQSSDKKKRNLREKFEFEE
jgi:hypothetical protein